jgi:hypothetical protein
MVRRGTVSLGLGIVLAAGGAIVAAPAQDRPGFPTQARVWIENRDPAEAVPVTVIRTPNETPWHVQIVGVPTVALSSASVLPTTRVRQSWEYRSVLVNTGADPLPALVGLGQDGWEATGTQLPAQNGTMILLKRPR